jgi:hypothetical protein
VSGSQALGINAGFLIDAPHVFRGVGEEALHHEILNSLALATSGLARIPSRPASKMKPDVSALETPVKIRHKSIASCNAMVTTAFFLESALGVGM